MSETMKEYITDSDEKWWQLVLLLHKNVLIHIYMKYLPGTDVSNDS